MKLACTLRLIEETMTAAAFAEEGDHETALELLSSSKEADEGSFRACSAGREECLGPLSSAA